MKKVQLCAEAHKSRIGRFVIIEKSQEECMCFGKNVKPTKHI